MRTLAGRPPEGGVLWEGGGMCWGEGGGGLQTQLACSNKFRRGCSREKGWSARSSSKCFTLGLRVYALTGRHD